jgi:hypothetical protein
MLHQNVEEPNRRDVEANLDTTIVRATIASTGSTSTEEAVDRTSLSAGDTEVAHHGFKLCTRSASVELRTSAALLLAEGLTLSRSEETYEEQLVSMPPYKMNCGMKCVFSLVSASARPRKGSKGERVFTIPRVGVSSEILGREGVKSVLYPEPLRPEGAAGENMGTAGDS